MKQNLQSNPDDSLRQAVLARLAFDDRTAGVKLRVGVLNGIVHLAGVVSSSDIRLAAAALVEEVPGVRGVVNRIEAPGAPSPGRRINLDLRQKKENTDE